jgi:hypothetical protein
MSDLESCSDVGEFFFSVAELGFFPSLVSSGLRGRMRLFALF